ncbi:hypothetical protein HUU05_25490 [candidate division KSB1 bacterium]|nr:hypothetical protein [candidate division KSB1 bacterium]
MKKSRTALVLFALLFFANSNLFAQPSLTARPLPHCRSFFITEFGYGYKATSPLKQRTFNTIGDSIWYYEYRMTGRHLLSSELGLMYNLNADYGLGFTHFFGWDVGHHLHGGVKLRVRKWLSEKASIDVSGGVLLWGAESEFEYPSFIGGASLNFSDWESLNLTVTTLQTKSFDYTYFSNYEGVRYGSFTLPQRDIGVYLGYKLSSKPGLAFNAAALTAFAAVVVAFLAAGPYD